MPYQTTILAGHVDVGDIGAKTIGLLWLVTALAFGIAALGAFLHNPWWPKTTTVVAVASLALCVVGWPEARIGVAINLGIIFAIVAGKLGGWTLVNS